ncbi:MarR family winged helix-turn-helix transcriptional regulator [Ruminococcaceae bacterium OttesenSCG-928-A16]|nr:MarR family winged helix-turn-helix transcriptional regulator [Ruminococcaceae bacterium OttesenSCG-928-A16]
MAIPFHSALTHAYHAQKNALRPRMGSVGLSPGQPKILYYLAGHNNSMQKDIAIHCDIEPATVSRILNNMEEKGLIERTAAKGNRRAAAICITAKGRAANARWEEICSEVEQTELHGFTPEEKQAFENYLQRLYQNFTGRIFD